MSDRAQLVADIRRFNRFYTHRIGLLEETLTASPYTLTEARVLFELGYASRGAEPSVGGERDFLGEVFHLNSGPAASEIAEILRLDPAYLTRILRKFAAAGLTQVCPDPGDRRRRILSLTKKGRSELAALQAAADKEIGRLVESLSDDRLGEFGRMLHSVTELFGGAPAQTAPVVLRPHVAGDIGWVIGRQSRLYADEYGWNNEYEALVCEICAAFIRNFKPGKEFCWIAEREGERLGAVFLVQKSEDVAQLRMLHVERAARGMGVGSRLVAECVETARRAGYRRIVLWTNDVLADARRLYERAGFGLASEERHRSFGKDLNGQYWELDL